jgi:hypothetical protein
LPWSDGQKDTESALAAAYSFLSIHYATRVAGSGGYFPVGTHIGCGHCRRIYYTVKHFALEKGTRTFGTYRQKGALVDTAHVAFDLIHAGREKPHFMCDLGFQLDRTRINR